MKKIRLIVLVLIVCSFLQSNAQVKGNQYFLTGKLIRTLYLPAYCGIFAWATVAEFEVVRFSDKDYFKDSIPVIICCPREHGENFFVKDKTYQLTVADQNQAEFSWAITNRDVLAKYRLKKEFWSIEIK